MMRPFAMGTRSKLNLVMVLTFVRFPLVLLFFGLALIYVKNDNRPWLFVLALGSLILSAVTDIFDGYLARKFQVVTKFGAHADPLMDKLFYLSTLPLLVFVATRNNHLSHAIFLLVMTVFFLARDQWVTFLRSIGSMYAVSGSANWAGKLRTIINFPMICAVYYFEEAPARWEWIPPWLMHSFEGVAFVINFVSLYIYSRQYWPYLEKSAHDDSLFGKKE